MSDSKLRGIAFSGLLAAVLICAGSCRVIPTIVVEDMHAAAWMAMENASFHFHEENDGQVNEPQSVCSDTTKAWGPCDPAGYETEYRHGVLFQMGYQVSFTDDDEHGDEQAGDADGTSRTEDTHFGGIYIKHSKGEEWLLPGVSGSKSFDWLDVREAGAKCVIDPYGAYMMLVSPTLGLDNGCPDPLTLEGSDYYCARNRSVHVDVEARWLVTYWGGEDFYQMKTGETTEATIVTPDGTTFGATHGSDSHVSYSFALPNDVTVDRWNLGCFEETYAGVSEIRILFHEPAVWHLGYAHFPMNGGR